jgi:hypothetical protein
MKGKDDWFFDIAVIFRDWQITDKWIIVRMNLYIKYAWFE